MFCCNKGSQGGNNPPPILDVQQVLMDYLWECYADKTRGPRRLFLRRSNYHLHVPMNYFHFDVVDQSLTPRVKQQMGDHYPVLDQKSHGDCNKTADKPDTLIEKDAKLIHKNSNMVETTTDFLNDTDEDQIFKFRIEKTRKAALSVSFQKGFTVGGRANFSVAIPKITELGIESTMTLNITKQDTENVEETLVFETTSDINVKRRSKCVARAVFAEAKVSYDFKVLCRMTMPTGEAPLTITRKKDGEVVFATSLTDLQKVFQKFDSRVKIVKFVPPGSDMYSYYIDIETVGIVEGVRLSDQHIVLESSKNPSLPAS